MARRGALVGVLAAVTLAVFSLIGLRNWIVSGRYVPASTEFGITLLGGTEIPEGVTIDPSPRIALYSRLGVGEFTVRVIEYAIAAPGLFAVNLGRKALFVLGFYEPYAPGWGYSPVYIAVWATALVGLVMVWQRHRAFWVVIPALVAVTQFIAIVIVYPKGERLVIPVQIVLVPYACAAVWFVSRRWLETACSCRRPSAP